MKPAVIYCRFVPYAPYTLQRQSSIDTQLYYCMRYCTAHRYEVVGAYYDRGVIYTRKASPKPGYDSAVKAACDQKALLLTYSLGRITSNENDLIHLIEKLFEHGASFGSAKEDINTDSIIGQHFLPTLKSIASIKSEAAIERRLTMLLSSPKNVSHRHSSYGVVRDEMTGDLIECPAETAVIAFILECHKNKCTLGEIRAALKYKKLPYRKRKKWSNLLLRNVIKKAQQEAYIQGHGPIPLAGNATLWGRPDGGINKLSSIKGICSKKAAAVKPALEEAMRCNGIPVKKKGRGG